MSEKGENCLFHTSQIKLSTTWPLISGYLLAVKHSGRVSSTQFTVQLSTILCCWLFSDKTVLEEAGHKVKNTVYIWPEELRMKPDMQM